MSQHEIRPGTLLYCCTEKPVKSPADLDIAIRYEPGMPDSWPAEARRKVQRLKAVLGDAGILGSWSPHGPFNNASLLIDRVNVLQNGTVDEVKRETEQAIKIGKPGGKFILQSADFLEYGTPMDNIEAYVLTAKQFCDY